ncbi:hypothetical protein [Fructobacillus evanidus]|uniref:Uncharacterized protein n=1 Tax=Fructobacillus evanidus TaxID=3064281 RepID=A0ABN9YTX6_9LACO|nr:hypothetical protein R55250_KEHBDPNM_00651 [Fructobacillus sp. LMG 32999]CAK1229239.1 hypothetical protein R53718_MFFEMHAI_00628 [Fructobacillus sp. LMG 32999]CAK1231382.1 hypothetical protein R53534_HOPDCFKK_00362 [Fructobacillus sp. LMG 32999]CAK1231491.1 hypothetical protein R54837_OMAIDLJD_00374 [Fructobacillus sp. LMG 32999]CAK1232595.1 hypothetical protein R55234_GCHJJDIB_00372 [Fructobacillus sp. LMG 32999]
MTDDMTVGLKDLRRFATVSNQIATAKMKNHEILELHPRALLGPEKKALIDGQNYVVRRKYDLQKGLYDIQTIRAGDQLLAERVNGQLVMSDQKFLNRSLPLSEKAFQLLREYADAHGVTLDQALDQAIASYTQEQRYE